MFSHQVLEVIFSQLCMPLFVCECVHVVCLVFVLVHVLMIVVVPNTIQFKTLN